MWDFFEKIEIDIIDRHYVSIIIYQSVPILQATINVASIDILGNPS